MLTGVPVLATQKRPRVPTAIDVAAAVVIFLLAGCSPPGPRALLQGERLIRDGKHAQAIDKLRQATELLPRSSQAQAWNYLGLAYHGAGQATNAVVAYRKALALNRDLVAAHYNLGCLWLEQNNLPAAVEEFTSFVAHPLQTKHVDGWLKLGTACIRARRWDEAERAYNHLLRKLEVRTPEVFNNLGVIQVQRRHPSEAILYFNSALSLQQNHGPALFNLATLYQQQPATRSQALQKYREYLALQLPGPNAAVAEAQVHQLEAALSPPLASATTSNLTVAAVTRSNPPVHAPSTPSRRTTSNTTSTANAPGVPLVARTPSNPPPALSPAAVARSSSTPIITSPSPPVRVATSAPPKTVEPPVAKSKPVELTSVPDDLVVRPVQDVATTPSFEPEQSAATAAPNAQIAAKTSQTNTPDGGRTVLQKLNPFSNRSKKGDELAAAKPAEPVSLSSSSAAGRAVDEPGPVFRANPIAAEPPPPSFPRYSYISPAAPSPGKRAEAEKSFLAGAKAQREGRTSEAMNQYLKATQVDPAYFEAYYNLGLAAAAMGNARQALKAGEYALVLKPDSADARYNFALALKQAGYALDSAEELRKLASTYPNQTRALLSLANLYAYQLRQPQQAREHFQRVLAIDPQHPQAAQIRHWLANHP